MSVPAKPLSTRAAVAYLNGQWLPPAEARVSVYDRGFLFADGVYEVIPVYGDQAFALSAHLARLARSLGELRIANPHSDAEWESVIARLIRDNPSAPGTSGDRMIYLQVTRGAPARRGHAFPPDTPPTVVGLCGPLAGPTLQERESGVAAVTLPDQRWSRCDIKSVSLLPNLLATQAAAEQKCNEAILHRDGRVTEGASSNVFAVLGGAVVTPPKGPEILAGITRDVLLGLLREAGVRVEERWFTLDALRGAEEVWVTSSTREVLAVRELDRVAVGAGRPGDLWQKAFRLFQDAKRRGP